MAPSRWHGSPAVLADLGLAADRPVEREDLTSLMQGVSPVDGVSCAGRAAMVRGSRGSI